MSTEAANSTPGGKGEHVWAEEIWHLFSLLAPGIGVKGSKKQRPFPESHCHSLPVLKWTIQNGLEDNNKIIPYPIYLPLLSGPPNAHLHHNHWDTTTRPIASSHPDGALLLFPSHFILVPATPFQQLLLWPGFVQVWVWRPVSSVASLNICESWGHVAFQTDTVSFQFESSWRHFDGQKEQKHVSPT